jgi:transcriptional regulator with XRE-family HTH domain
MYYETFAQKLKQARFETGFTQREVAEMIKINHSTLAGYETGRTQPDIETLGKLIDLYGISADWLLGTKGGK